MAEGCKNCAPPSQTGTLNVIPRNRWPEDWIRMAAPNDLLLLGPVGKAGAILRLPFAGAFVVLSPDQVWKRRPSTWPLSNGTVKRFRIEGTRIVYYFK